MRHLLWTLYLYMELRFIIRNNKIVHKKTQVVNVLRELSAFVTVLKMQNCCFDEER